MHRGSDGDLAGGSEDKEAGTPHPPLPELSSAPANPAAPELVPRRPMTTAPSDSLIPANSVPLSRSPPAPLREPKPTSPVGRFPGSTRVFAERSLLL